MLSAGVHIHVGSQGVPLDKFVSGGRVLMDFVSVLEERCPAQIKVVDIGGGLSTTYTEAEEPEEFSYQKYREQLDKEVGMVEYKIIVDVNDDKN